MSSFQVLIRGAHSTSVHSPPGYVRFHQFQHVEGCLVDLDEHSIVYLPQSQQLEDLAHPWTDTIDTGEREGGREGGGGGGGGGRREGEREEGRKGGSQGERASKVQEELYKPAPITLLLLLHMLLPGTATILTL